ncbi:MAG: response regulator transcription factor [Bacillota bacterium]
MNLLKLLIADDEYLVIDSLKMIIAKNIKDIDIVGTAVSGREAIEKAVELKPDIVFMDIHMPGIDGMEALRQIRTANSDIAFVILTAYDFFDYAKEAINLGVSEYLLKPINKQKVIETIEKLKENIKHKRKSLIRELELKEKLNRITPYIEEQFISYHLFNIGTVRDIEFYEDIFKVELKQGYAMTILLEHFEGEIKEDSIKLSIEKQNLYEAFRLELKRLCPCLIGNPLLDRITAFIPVEDELDTYEIRNRSIQIAKRIIDKVRVNTSLKYKIGIGRRYRVDCLTKSFNEAYIAASVPDGQGIMHFEDITPSNNDTDNYPAHFESTFANRIVSCNIRGAMEVFKEIFFWLKNSYCSDTDKVKSRLIDLIFVTDKALPYKLADMSKMKQGYVTGILKSSSFEELESQFVQFLSDLSFELESRRKSELDGIIPNVLKYLDDNYYKNITLDDAAKRVNLSYHYFGKIFKDEVGKNFVDYLTELRIEKSMRFLSNSKISIKEICHKIGYNDPNYYCKIFKKITGMTPTEYRSSIQNVR